MAKASSTRKPATARKPAAKSPVEAAPAPAPASELAPDADEPTIVQALDTPSKWSGAIVAGGLMLVAGLSFFAIRGIRRRK